MLVRHPHVRRLTRAALALALALAALPSAAPAQVSAQAETTYTFNGGGWGHGIGLSQYGAKGYANQGKSYSWIVTHYYQGTSLVTKPTVTVRVNLDADGSSRSKWWVKSGTTTTMTVAQVSNTSRRVSLSASKSYWVVGATGNTQVCNDSTYTIVNKDGSTSVGHRPGSVVATFSGECYATAGGKVQLLGASGPFDYTGIKWRGTIHFRPYSSTSSNLKAINYVDIEQYLYGVVPRESPSSWPAEALKAQAVAARSYAWQDAYDKNTIYCSTRSQVYNGYSRPSEVHEAASTNAAVDATKAKVVWYAGETKPVKTYFSSCTGGHTANIEDVWLSAAPKPYYRGVDDADQDSPYYRWSAGPYTASTLAGKVRAFDAAASSGLQYSEPSPATITGMSLDRASSGFTRYVTLRWSTGASYTIKGDTMRQILDLRSTKFWVKVSTPATAVKYEQTDSRLAWSGAWYTLSNSAYSGSSMRCSTYAGSRLIARFNGTGVSWIGSTGPALGKADVYLDGTKVMTRDLYSSSLSNQRTLYTRTGLASGNHTLQIVVTGTKNAMSTGTMVPVDRIDTYGSLAQATTPVYRYEDSSVLMAPLGGWRTGSSSTLSGGSQIYTDKVGATVRMRFLGTAVRWIGSVGPGYGKASVSVDGSAPVTVSLTSSTVARQRAIFSKFGLSASKTHTIVITALGGPSSAVDVTSVDRIDTASGWALTPYVPPASFEQTSGALAYSGTWASINATAASGGSYVYSSRSGTSATVRFEGTSITWYGPMARSCGKAEVWLDGSKLSTLDLYSPTTKQQVALFSKSGLACRPHTLVIKVLGSRNASATSSAVAVDAFRVNGLPILP